MSLPALSGWETPDRGALFVVSGPSGVGKSTLVRRVMQRVPGLVFSVSATTRAPRPGEVDGVDYQFVAPERFDALLAEDAFVEHATVYGKSYGTLRAPAEQAMANGRSLVLDIDVQGAEQVRVRLPEAVHIFILPPSLDVLEGRLRARATDDEAAIRRRMAMAAAQLVACEAYDFIVVNDVLDTAHACFEGVVLAELSRASRRKRAMRRILDRL